MQLELWTRARDRFAGVKVRDLVPEFAQVGFGWTVTTTIHTRLLHKLHRRVPRGAFHWPARDTLPRWFGLDDNLERSVGPNLRERWGTTSTGRPF